MQAAAIIGRVARARPGLEAFFGCLYYAALRPEEAVALRADHCQLPPARWGQLTISEACPRAAPAWTDDGSSYQWRGLKHRPDGAVRVVPIPPILVEMLRRHLRDRGTTPDGRLFRGPRGGMLSESRYGRTWHAARAAAPGPDLAATPLARRPYDLRHAALSCGWPPAPIPPKSPGGPATASASCTPRTPAASMATTKSPASGSNGHWQKDTMPGANHRP